MDSETGQTTSVAPVWLDVLIISQVRLLRESLAEILGRSPAMHVRGQSEDLTGALHSAETMRPEIMLFDVAFPGGRDAVARLTRISPDSSIIVIPVTETEETVLSWAEAGVSGYVSNTASANELVSLIRQIRRGEQTCGSRIAGGLLRRVASSGRAPSCETPKPLTRREAEISRLMRQGLSNKDIARRLDISVGTTKSHVHNLLGKSGLRSRTELIAGGRGGFDA